MRSASQAAYEGSIPFARSTVNSLKGIRMRTHRLDAGPDTVHWGYFDASLKPLVTIEPGDEVVMSTVSGAPQQMPNPS